MNMSTSTLLPTSPPAALSTTTTADTNELMKKIDYFIKVKINFRIRKISFLPISVSLLFSSMFFNHRNQFLEQIVVQFLFK